VASQHEVVARGVGPPALRKALAIVAALYFAALVKSPPQLPGLHAVTFFTEATCLFPNASTYAIEFRIETWSCRAAAWRPFDPRPLFPIDASNKESRFQRIAYFYQRNRTVMRALDAWIVQRASDADRAGGIRLTKQLRALPEPGQPVARYEPHPLDPIPDDERRLVYQTLARERTTRCAGDR